MPLGRSESPPRGVPAGAPGSGPESKGPIARLCPSEPLDIAGARCLIERAGPLLPTCQRLLVDLQGVDFIDSSGVRALLYLATELEEDGKELRLVVRRGSRVERTLGLLRLLGRLQADYVPADVWKRGSPVPV